MKKVAEMAEGIDIAANDPNGEGIPDDFHLDDLYILKTVFLELEKVGLFYMQLFLFIIF